MVILKFLLLSRILLVLACFLILSCSKETDPEWVTVATGGNSNTLPEKVKEAQQYNAFPASRRSAYFHEDFTNNSNGWLLSAPVSAITGGIFFSTGRGVLITKVKPIDEARDFEVECVIGFRDMLSNGNNGFVWNYNAASNRYWGVFDLPDQANMSQEIAQAGLFNNGSIELSVAQKQLTGYNASGVTWNTYTMRKVGEYLITFIDGTRVSTKKYKPTQGTALGINDPGGIGIDKIYIDYIN